MIPMVDLGKQFAEIREEIMNIVDEILESSHYILGPRVHEFEQRITEYLKVSDALGVASGTDALHLSIEALNIGEGDEVITTPFTFFATVEAIAYTGATPVFVDIEPETFTIDCTKIEEKITSRTKAILPVHLFGHPADMEQIMVIAEKYGLRVLEDCAQAFGAAIQGRKVGSFGDMGCFSFYPSKNLGACGDGGMISLREHSFLETIKSLRNHGSKGSYQHDAIGFNSRLDELQAGILLVKLQRVDEYNRKRREKASHYGSLLSGVVTCPREKKGVYHVYNQYTILCKNRDEVQQRLRENGVSSVVYYPRPLHLQDAISFLGHRKGEFPVTEKASREVLSLPMYAELEESDIEKIASVVKRFAQQ
ncbi:MAG TPA: DegT/DnrJ/EryC1/StrS family aminotransferase [Thermodesulfovibrionales bacterium]|nr:DegT/DnrJ/EryC1/StrS family aminotransferase [Thermodesulfovibrionales bacterium]